MIRLVTIALMTIALSTSAVTQTTALSQTTHPPQPPVAKKVHTERTLNGTHPGGRLRLAARALQSRREGLPRSRERLRRDDDRVARPAAPHALRRDRRPHQGDRRHGSLPQRRLLLLLPHREGQAVQHRLPQEGFPRCARAGAARPEPDGRGQAVHVGRLDGGQRRRQLAGLHHRQCGIPPVSPARSRPAHRTGPARHRGAG